MIARGSVDNITLYIIFLLLPVLQRNYIIIYTDTRYFSVAYDHFIAKAKNSLNVAIISNKATVTAAIGREAEKDRTATATTNKKAHY